MKNSILVTKANGEREAFNAEKLRTSLTKAGASSTTSENIIEHITAELNDGMSTNEIYNHANFLLEKKERPSAARYSLRRAVLDLGPTGFPFERFIAEMFREKGYTVENGQIVKGFCAEHEIDVVAYNENKLIMVEAKFHNSLGLKSDLKVALYVKARFEDLKGVTFDYGGERRLDEGWLITNTKFTTQAIRYAECQGLRLVGWNYPVKGSLQDMIDDSGLHPLTCLTTISKKIKNDLLLKNVVLCKSIALAPEILAQVGLNEEESQVVLDEISALMVAPIDAREARVAAREV